MIDCSAISAGLVAAECGKMATAGTTNRVVLINYNDIDKASCVVTSNVISSIVLKATKKGYMFDSHDGSSIGEASLNKMTYISNFQHDVTLRIFKKTEDAKAFVNSLNGARLVALIENKEGGDEGETKWEAYGYDAGLVLNEVSPTTEMTDGVVYEVKLGSSDTSKEGSIAKSVFVTDASATETMILGLIS